MVENVDGSGDETNKIISEDLKTEQKATYWQDVKLPKQEYFSLAEQSNEVVKEEVKFKKPDQFFGKLGGVPRKCDIKEDQSTPRVINYVQKIKDKKKKDQLDSIISSIFDGSELTSKIREEGLIKSEKQEYNLSAVSGDSKLTSTKMHKGSSINSEKQQDIDRSSISDRSGLMNSKMEGKSLTKSEKQRDISIASIFDESEFPISQNGETLNVSRKECSIHSSSMSGRREFTNDGLLRQNMHKPEKQGISDISSIPGGKKPTNNRICAESLSESKKQRDIDTYMSFISAGKKLASSRIHGESFNETEKQQSINASSILAEKKLTSSTMHGESFSESEKQQNINEFLISDEKELTSSRIHGKSFIETEKQRSTNASSVSAENKLTSSKIYGKNLNKSKQDIDILSSSGARKLHKGRYRETLNKQYGQQDIHTSSGSGLKNGGVHEKSLKKFRKQRDKSFRCAVGEITNGGALKWNIYGKCLNQRNEQPDTTTSSNSGVGELTNETLSTENLTNQVKQRDIKKSSSLSVNDGAGERLTELELRNNISFNYVRDESTDKEVIRNGLMESNEQQERLKTNFSCYASELTHGGVYRASLNDQPKQRDINTTSNCITGGLPCRGVYEKGFNNVSFSSNFLTNSGMHAINFDVSEDISSSSGMVDPTIIEGCLETLTDLEELQRDSAISSTSIDGKLTNSEGCGALKALEKQQLGIVSSNSDDIEDCGKNLNDLEEQLGIDIPSNCGGIEECGETSYDLEIKQQDNNVSSHAGDSEDCGEALNSLEQQQRDINIASIPVDSEGCIYFNSGVRGTSSRNFGGSSAESRQSSNVYYDRHRIKIKKAKVVLQKSLPEKSESDPQWQVKLHNRENGRNRMKLQRIRKQKTNQSFIDSKKVSKGPTRGTPIVIDLCDSESETETGDKNQPKMLQPGEMRQQKRAKTSAVTRDSENISTENDSDYDDEFNFTDHSLTKIKLGDERIDCPLCPPVLTFQSWYEHNSNDHPAKVVSSRKGQYFGCPYCTAGFIVKDALKYHLKVHFGSDRNLKSHSCPHCTARFKLKSMLKYHLRVHSAEFIDGHNLKKKRYSCQHCSARFKFEFSLKEHLIVHSDEWYLDKSKPFSCSQCPARFKFDHSLNKHLKVHSNESGVRLEYHLKKNIAKRYSCPECSAKFKYKQSMKYHMKMHERAMFSCAYCPKKYSYKCHLVQHLNRHFSKRTDSSTESDKLGSSRHTETNTDDKIYNCSYCSKEFRTEHSLKEHLMVHCNDFLVNFV